MTSAPISDEVAETVVAPAAAPDHSAFPALDGIRAMAVAAVVGTHAAYWTYRYGRGPGSGLLVHLDSGVAIFFVISGFLLSRPWLVAAATGGPAPALRVYFWRRALRILPAYWIALLFASLALSANRLHGTTDWLRHLGFLQIYRLGWLRGGLSQTWSLCTEVGFYLLLPALGVLVVAASRRWGWRPGWLLAGCGLLVIATEAWYVWIHAELWSIFTMANFWLPGFLSWFAGGMALAVVQVHLKHRPPAEHGRWVIGHTIGASAGACWIGALGLFVITATPIAGPRTVGFITTTEAIVRNLLYTALAVLIAWPAVLGPGGWARAVFGNRVMRWLGDISYSVFLLHVVILEGVVRLLGYRLFTGSVTPVFVLTWSASVALAALTYRYVERPAMSLRRLVRAPRRHSAPVSAQRDAEPTGDLATAPTQ